MSRILTLQDLQSRTLSELHLMLADLRRTLADAPLGSSARRDALARFDLVSRAIRLRAPGPRPR